MLHSPSRRPVSHFPASPPHRLPPHGPDRPASRPLPWLARLSPSPAPHLPPRLGRELRPPPLRHWSQRTFADQLRLHSGQRPLPLGR